MTVSKAGLMTFGIELECYMPEASFHDFQGGGYHSGRPIPIPGTSGGWQAQSDSSIRPGPGCRAIEIVSPILQGGQGFAEVLAVLKWLKERKAGCNSSCGLHVHIGVDGKKVGWQVLAMVAQHEAAFWAASGSKGRERENNRFCRNVRTNTNVKDSWEKREAMDRGDRNRNTAAVTDRYQMINLSNLWNGRFNAVEFRAFAATFRPGSILGILRLCLGVVDYAQACRSSIRWDPRTPSRVTGLDAMLVLLRKLAWGKPSKTGKGNWGWVDCADPDFGSSHLAQKKYLINMAKSYEVTLPVAASQSS